MKKSSIFEWHKHFKEGHKNMEDEHSSHPSSNRINRNVDKVWNLVHSDSESTLLCGNIEAVT